MTSNLEKSDDNRNKRKKETENETSENLPMPFEKTNASLSESSQLAYKTEALETVLNDTSKEISVLISKYARMLSERAAMDASYVEELEGILKETVSVENHLKMKQESLQQRFAAIANPLQSENGLPGKCPEM
ncbi:testis-expressed protein 12 [Heteronotia binoei]|uniref:testis-expressed protein 12 n=1 Tax=Heteronotia binoei TaxID=13085 RepID=UPI0029304BBA|nr:testis-expressed protein 12 [Heteronotia binoei]